MSSRTRQDGPRTRHEVGRLAVEVEAHHRYEIGQFVVTFVPSVHAKLLAGVKMPSGGEAICEHVGELRPDGYGCRQVWGHSHRGGRGNALYHQGAAELLDDGVPPSGVDPFLCGIAGR
ncbi:hypothetical protein ACH492_36905 [Streptomyces sp. NPDC019443]|uniref:hypothetical protein n=1 Tax=Streptomyces sp. NPDC019443 TaxID=3365061 RepID=UPI0037A13BEB